jgi:hypothetical protein
MVASFVRLNNSSLSTAESTSSISGSLVNLASFLNLPDPVYGTGADGDVTITADTTLSRDFFYRNLTVNAGIKLNPGGYRIFVQNVLTLNSNSEIGYTTGFTTAGTLAQGGAANTAVTHSLGGSSGAQTATAPTAALGGTAYYQQPLQAIRGWAVTASSVTPTFLRGGAGGSSGAGGGVVLISARYITVSSGTASFKAPGTPGAGGGGGGVILIVSSASVLNASISTVVTGGTGASAGTVNYMQVA